MKWGKRLEELLRYKKIRKDQCLILVLTGILLCVIALPVKDDKKLPVTDETVTAGLRKEEVRMDRGEEYTDDWEKRLEETLSCIEGAGKVRVLITLRESESRVVEKDKVEENSDTVERDSTGGTRSVMEQKEDGRTVFAPDAAGQNVPYVVKTTAPVVEGVVVVAQGADNSLVKQEIIASVQVLFNLDVNKIRVVKMKNINQ